jgi:hypothetical protein
MINETYAEEPHFPHLFEELVSQQLLDRETANEVIRAASCTAPRLGSILVEARVLRIGDVMKVLAVQADDPNRRFGELAVSLGFCREADIKWALQRQRECTRHPLEELALRRLMSDQALLHFLICCIKHGKFGRAEGATAA